MSRRLAGFGSLLLAGLLLGLPVLALPAAGQPEPPLEVKFREGDTRDGRLKATFAMSGSAWTGNERLAPADFTASFNGRPGAITGATPLQGEQGQPGKQSQLSVILAVDTSGSMLVNNNIATAKVAAESFVRKLRPGTKVGVISFANEPAVTQKLTTDTNRVVGAVRGLRVDDPLGDTALYDAIVLASGQLAGQAGQRSLVVLSDGKHEGTTTKIDQAIKEAEKAGVIIDAVMLQVAGFEDARKALRRLASETDGDVASARSDELEARFNDKARELSSQYVVEIRLPEGLGSQVDFRLRVQANGAEDEYRDPAFFIGTQAGPSTPAAPAQLQPAPALSLLEGERGRYIFALTAFTTVLIAGLLLFGSGLAKNREYRALRQRMSPYSLTSVIADDQPRPTAFGSSEWAGRATAMAETLVRRGNLEETFLDRLEAAGLNMRVAEFVLISLGSAFIPPLLILVLTRNLIITVVVVLLGVIGPFVFLAVKASRRQAKFEEQLPSTLQLLAGALQAGHSLQQAVDTVVHEAGDPISGEFQRVLTEARLGRPLEEAFQAMAKRTGSVDFEWTVMAIRLQRQVGGNLAEVLGTVAQTIRDRYSLRRQIKALSAEGRLSSLILSVLPILMFGALLMFNPLFLRPLYSTALGLMMLGGAAVLMIVGVIWLKNITEIKV
jgi:tight adherence protein B